MCSLRLFRLTDGCCAVPSTPSCWNGSTAPEPRPQATSSSFTLVADTQLAGHYLSQGNFSLAAAEAKCSGDSKCTGFCFPAAEPGGGPAPKGVRHVFFKGSHRSFSSPGWSTYCKSGAPFSPYPPPPPPGPPTPPGHKANCCPVGLARIVCVRLTPVCHPLAHCIPAGHTRVTITRRATLPRRTAQPAWRSAQRTACTSST